SEDDLTHKLVDVIRINQRLRENIDAGAPQLIIEDLWDLLQYHVTTYFDNESSGIPPARHRSGRALKTVAQRLKGKEGRFRYNLTGKRVNFAGRTVVSPDCFLGINQVGIPERVAQELTVPESVTEYNIDVLRKIVLNEEYPKANYVIRPDKLKKKITELTREVIAEELEEGYVVERQLVEGDVVLFNRQPSLHRVSMMAHEVKVTPNKTFSFNTFVCPAYNADFDGDEMNLHVPQTVEAQVEARELLLVENQIISPRYGKPIIAADEDPVAGGFILTRSVKEYTREEAMHYSFLTGAKTLPKPDRGEKYSGKLLFSQLLPPGIDIEFTNGFCEKCEECKKENCKNDAFVSIKDSLLVSGAIDEFAIGVRKGALLDSICKYIGAKEAREFLDKFMKLSNTILAQEGLTVSSSDYDLSDRIKEKIKEMTVDAENQINQIVSEYKSGIMESIPGMTEEESFDMRILQVTGNLKKKVEGFVGDSLFTFKSESKDSIH
ncbi:MAG: DNA-directed RNA polymerase subunit A', partial [Candidatus Diapherotrites archaeon]|nr:DNA-directed RNA polymerase subunit A' [Candidatus Diapherotrites archaeon]